MKKQFFLVLLLAVFSLILAHRDAKAQSGSGASVYTTVDYNANNNIASSYSYTYATYDNLNYYKTQVSTFLYDPDSNILAADTNFGNLQSDLSLSSSGTGCGEYMVLSYHQVIAQYYVNYYYYYGDYVDGFYDPFNYLRFSEQGYPSPTPGSYFASVDSYIRVLEQANIDLGPTQEFSSGNCAPPTVASITASIPSTKNPITNQAPQAGVFSTTNTATAFATESTTDMMVLFQSSSTSATITAQGITSASIASRLKWKIDRDSTDSVGNGTPSLSSLTSSQITFNPTTAGNFRLICYYDTNNNGSYDNGEALRVLLFSVVRVSVDQNNCTIDSPLPVFNSDPPQNGEFAVTTAEPMASTCAITIEGGGSNRRIGVSKLHFGDVGNLTSDTAKVIYKLSGIATENPGGTLPMYDSDVAQGVQSPGGSSVFRASSSDSPPTNIMNGGQSRIIIARDAPSFGPYPVVHPNTNNTWGSTQGGYDFTEYIAGYSVSFPRNYVVLAKGTWTIKYVGSRGKNGVWNNTGSSVTLQGMAGEESASFNITVNNGSPQKGDDAGIQVLGLSYVNNYSPVFTQ
jgi:hypothetical protein